MAESMLAIDRADEILEIIVQRTGRSRTGSQYFDG